MRQRRRRAFDRGTGGDGQDSAGRVSAGIPGAAARVPFAVGIDGVPFAAAFVRVSGAAPSTAASAAGVFARVAAGAAAWVQRAAASRQVVGQLGEQRR
jgi:hypothetical protein